MKKFIYLIVSIFVFMGSFLSVSLAEDRNFNQDPVDVLEAIKHNANKYKIEQVQNTKYDKISSKTCRELAVESKYTISRTLCSIKESSGSYLQYVVYAWLTLATIILIRNWFQLIISDNRWKQIGVFKQNIKYITIGVILLISFYWILDIFVSLVKFVEK